MGGGGQGKNVMLLDVGGGVASVLDVQSLDNFHGCRMFTVPK